MKTLISAIAFLCSTCLVAQKIDYGFYVGGNTCFIIQNSNYSMQDGPQYKLMPSYNLGTFIKTDLKRFNLLGSLEFARIWNTYSQAAIDNQGNDMMDLKPQIINYYASLSTMGTIKFHAFYIGTGISCNLLLFPKLKTVGVTEGNYDNTMINYSYKPIQFSVPFLVGCDIKRVGLFARFNYGLTNRLKSGFNVKEYENTVMTGVSFRVNKK